MQGVVDRAEAHGADGSEHGHLAALNDAHLMLIAAGLGVVHGVEGTDDAAHRLCQGAIEVGIGIVRQQVSSVSMGMLEYWLSPPQYW